MTKIDEFNFGWARADAVGSPAQPSCDAIVKLKELTEQKK
jgi:hypothetical protein